MHVYFPPTFEALSRVGGWEIPGAGGRQLTVARGFEEKGWERGVALAVIVSCLLLSVMRDKIARVLSSHKTYSTNLHSSPSAWGKKRERQSVTNSHREHAVFHSPLVTFSMITMQLPFHCRVSLSVVHFSTTC